MDVIIIVLVIIVVFLTIVLFLSGKAIVKTTELTGSDSTGNIYYFLPKGLIKITTVVKVLVYTDKERDIIREMDILSQSFIHEKEIVPDTSQVLKLNYVNSIFSKDEIDLKINDKGLITNIDVKTEDRLPNIIEALTKAPFTIAKYTEEKKIDTDYNVTIEEFTKTFIIDPYNLSEINSFIITKTDQYKSIKTIDASFTVHSHSPELSGKSASLPAREVVYGIITRPVILHTFIISPMAKGLENQEVQFYETLPNTNLNLNIPLSRAVFSIKTNKLLFSDGMILGNKMEKPSELEGLISIPINIAKAIISIPAQLFQFRIDTTKSKTALEAEVLKLNKVISDQTIPELQKELDTLKKEIEKLKGKKS